MLFAAAATLALLTSAAAADEGGAAPGDATDQSTTGDTLTTPPPTTAPETVPATTPAAPATTPAEAKATPNIGFKNGFFIQSDDGVNRMVIHMSLQPRAELKASDADVSSWSTRFSIFRAQLELGGNVFAKDLGYQFKLETGQGFVFLKDAWFNYVFIPEVLELRVGQGKRPFSRLELTGDTKLAFVDRGEINSFFKSGRDIGISVHNNIDKSPNVEWAFGLFGSATDKPTISGIVNVDEKVIDKVKESNVVDPIAPTLVGRIGFNQGDVKGYDEIDTDGTSDLRFAIAGSVLEAFEPVAGGNRGATRAEIDGIVKLIGADASAAVFAATKQTAGEQTLSQELDAIGVHAQVGYLIGGTVHPGFRYEYIQKADSSSLQELTGGLTVFVFGQNAAVQVDGTAFLASTSPVFDAARPPTELRTRAQLNLYF